MKMYLPAVLLTNFVPTLQQNQKKRGKKYDLLCLDHSRSHACYQTSRKVCGTRWRDSDKHHLPSASELTSNLHIKQQTFKVDPYMICPIPY